MKKDPFFPRKQLGQNFLVDPNIRRKIAEACELKPDQEIIEIGPGLGHLTEYLLPQVKKIYALEKDYRFGETLQKRFGKEKIEVIETDVLKYDFNQLPAGLKVIGNLPYYISTPIIELMLEHHNRFPECFFMVQREFAERLVAKPGSKDYGSLSCFVQYYSDVKVLLKIPAGAFQPVPKVMSSFIRIRFREPQHKAKDEKKLFTLIRTAFGQRRKKILNPLKSLLKKEEIEMTFAKCGLSLDVRAEELSLENYIDLANAISSSNR